MMWCVRLMWCHVMSCVRLMWCQVMLYVRLCDIMVLCDIWYVVMWCHVLVMLLPHNVQKNMCQQLGGPQLPMLSTYWAYNDTDTQCISPVRFPHWLRSSPDWPLSPASGSWNWSSLTACASTSGLPLTSTKNQPASLSGLLHPVFDHFVIAYCKGSSNWRWGRPESKARMVAAMLDHLCSFLHLFLHLLDSMLPPFLSHTASRHCSLVAMTTLRWVQL